MKAIFSLLAFAAWNIFAAGVMISYDLEGSAAAIASYILIDALALAMILIAFLSGWYFEEEW